MVEVPEQARRAPSASTLADPDLADPDLADPDLADPDLAAVFRALPSPYSVLTPDLRIVTANDAYLTTTGRVLAELVGRKLFEAFPPPEDAQDESGVPWIQASLERVLATGAPETLPLQRYDIVDAVTGGPSERYWVISHVPVLDDAGQVQLLVQRAEDVTAFMRDREQGQQAIASGEPWRRRVQAVEAELVTLARDLAAALEAAATAATQVAALNEVALDLTAAQTVEDLELIVIDKGVRAMGADGGAVVTAADDGGWRISSNAGLGERVQAVYRDLAYDSALPFAHAARTGERVLLATRASGLAFHRAMHALYEDAQRSGWAFLPLTLGGRRLGSLAVSWVEEHTCTPDELALLDGLAAQCAQALDRIASAQAQQAAGAAVARMAEALQRSLLTELPEPDHLQIAARYVPAAQTSQIGGDWYDAFLVRDGSTCLVVGDVAGHDSDAAVAMAQVRNVLRGVAHALDDAPAAVLSALDGAMHDLAVGALATAVLARVEQGPDDARCGLRTLRWSNAGHPPPLLLHPGGGAELLHRAPDLLLGLVAETERADHTQVLAPGDTVLLYTDGLVERRGEDLDEGLERLREVAARLGDLTLEELCDALLTELGKDADDDVALLALRTHAEDVPRPADAGPQRLPADLTDSAMAAFGAAAASAPARQTPRPPA